MSATGAHIRPQPQEALPHLERRKPLPVAPRHRAADQQYELEAIRAAWDAEIDARHRITFEVTARICRRFAAELLKRGGRL